MEKVKYDLTKITLFIIFTSFIVSIFFVSKLEVLTVLAFVTIVMIIVEPLIVGIFWYLNTKSEDGLYFSPKGILVVNGKSRYDYPWEDLKFKVFSISSIFNYKYISFFIGVREQPYNYEVSSFNVESFSCLLQKYAPKSHELNKIFTKR